MTAIPPQVTLPANGLWQSLLLALALIYWYFFSVRACHLRLEELGAGEEWLVLELALPEDIKDGVKKGEGIHMIYKGIVKGNVIQLEDEVTLPDGMRVTVTPEQPGG